MGYGCTTCIGNSGPAAPEISEAVRAGDIVGASVLSGNRNFEGRVHPEVKMNFLASPPLVVAYALAGTMDIDLDNEPLGTGARRQAGVPEDIWPSAAGDPAARSRASVDSAMFRKSYASVFTGRRALERDRGAEGRDLSLGADARPTCGTRRTSRA